jgi:hypothetical protein
VIPNCPPALNDLVAKALAKEADDRYESMSEFARAIDRTIAELKLDGLPDEDVVGFVKGMLGERAEKRRTAIREGIKTADERAEQRQHEKAQQAAMLAQLRASGAVTPSNMPPPLMSIPPPPMGGISSIPPQPGTPQSTSSSSSLTHKGMVSDVAGPTSSSGKKKLAVLAFGMVGLGAIGAAVFIGMSPAPASPADQPITSPASSATIAATPAPTPSETAAAPAPTESAAPEASASASAAATTNAVPSKPPPVAAPAPRTTATTVTTRPTSDNLPRVRDPGF